MFLLHKSFLFRGLVLLICITGSRVYAQSYELNPNDTLLGTAPFNDVYHFTIEQNNITESSIALAWEKISVDVPIGWDAFLCDNSTCFTFFPDSGLMNTVNNSEYGFLSVGINPYEVEGTATIVYAVWDTAFAEYKDTLTWVVSSVNTVNVEENLHSSGFFSFYKGRLSTLNGALYSLRLVDLSGKTWIDLKEVNGVINLPLDTLPSSVYILIAQSHGHLFREKIYIVK